MPTRGRGVLPGARAHPSVTGGPAPGNGVPGPYLRAGRSVWRLPLRRVDQPGAAGRTPRATGRGPLSARQPGRGTVPTVPRVPDTATDPSGPHPLTGPARLGAFLALLALVAGAGWGVGRVANPPLPVPDLPTPSVFGPAGHGAGEGH